MSRKIKIAKAPQRLIDPSKVKKPHCPIHTETRMEFDIIREKWACQVSGCNQVATPKSAPEDKAVTFGKGGIQVRLIYTDKNEARVILIADNNVALDVTDFFNVKEIEEAFGVEESVKLAATTEFYISTPRKVEFLSTLYVMGIQNNR